MKDDQERFPPELFPRMADLFEEFGLDIEDASFASCVMAISMWHSAEFDQLGMMELFVAAMRDYEGSVDEQTNR